ncbi:CgeB family protein [Bradyrhizobium symbiodeficiens]|uniref:CgeB family protein n=1 Tax=Bradyrhizobium symbiodeficiens TaxID=1404367 RepID=UPI00140FDBC3|nr:glycosyltransferase [Bradyrhizobium symbiodeficiens]QIP01731.1 glycosyltransferase family 1 protein [Bradyrhizobium symbiodeficiens]
MAFLDSGNRSLHADFADLNIALVERVANWRPDVIFCVLMHYEIWFDTLDLIRANSPVLVVNWGTDDSWKFAQASRFFAEHVDLHVTTDDAAAEAALSYGLRNVLLSQWASSGAALAEPCEALECRYDVSFVGSMYGYRGEWISALRDSGITVSCFGHGTDNGVVNAAEIPLIYRTSRISLNFSGSGQSSAGAGGRQIKARTFEVPGAGGFLLTEAVSGLDRYFDLDREVVTFDTPHELIAKTRYFLDHPQARDNVARAGHARTRAEHTYDRRFVEILNQLQLLGDTRQTRSWTLSSESLADAVVRHRRLGLAKCVRAVLVVLLSAVFGRQRGPRVARRFIYELSWRLSGAATYSSRGLPGRLFYSES